MPNPPATPTPIFDQLARVAITVIATDQHPEVAKCSTDNLRHAFTHGAQVNKRDETGRTLAHHLAFVVGSGHCKEPLGLELLRILDLRCASFLAPSQPERQTALQLCQQQAAIYGHAPTTFITQLDRLTTQQMPA